MSNYQSIILQLKHQKVLPLFYHDDEGICIEVMKALYNAGIRSIEFTCRGESALHNFKAMNAVRNKDMPDLLLAVGTIRTLNQANDFIDAGADFLISPVFDAAICKLIQSKNKLWIPGCMTPTEIHLAEHAGCHFVKLFPGSLLGPSFVAGIKVLFPNVSFMPTGGVEMNSENLQSWFAAGVSAVGMGSNFITKKDMDDRNYSVIEVNARMILAMLKDITQNI
jgi:2-dehydro-3-deoxyphosphogluconate aldolase/(4S)-4-hydroxy-2-oxoglutarate aldolase